MPWNPALYLVNAGPRLRPALDLLQRASSLSSVEVKSVLDLGCGPGNLTNFLLEAFPDASVIHGVDSSAAMIQKAKSSELYNNAVNAEKISFSIDSIDTVSSKIPDNGKYDVVFSNAALHWLVGHDELMENIIHNLLNTHGVLAVQMPETSNQLSHTLMVKAAQNSGFEGRIQHVRIPRVDHSAKFYYDLLKRHCTEVDLWSTEYVQQLPLTIESGGCDRHPVLQYTRATGMQPILAALGNTKDEATFLMEYEKLLHEAYPVNVEQNVVLFPFRRFFFVAKKA